LTALATSIFFFFLQSLQLFTSVVMDAAGIDYHVMLAANALQQCLDVPELQPELLCALVKQTSRPHAAQSAAMAAAAAAGDGGGGKGGKHGGVQVSVLVPESTKWRCCIALKKTNLPHRI
jgi:hypothetical protein